MNCQPEIVPAPKYQFVEIRLKSILMASRNKSLFTVEWYIISKKTIYQALVALLVLMLLAGGLYWLYERSRNVVNSGPEFGSRSARFIDIDGTVRVKRANETEFRAASEEMSLEPGDTIQTLGNAVARVQFVDGSSYTIKPDTTLIIKDNSLLDDKTTRVQVAVGTGRINLSTVDQASGSTNEVETGAASAKIAGQTEASVIAGDQTEIQVARGAANVRTSTGESFEAKSNERLGFDAQGKLTVREKMLPIPDLFSPENQAQIRIVSGRSGEARFLWRGVAQARSYRVEVATSAYFGDTVVAQRDQLISTEAVFSNLTPGNYYWRVRANGDKESSVFSDPFKFSIVGGQDSQAVRIEITNQVALGGNIYKVEGRSEPGARVRVGDKVARVEPDGRFSALVSIPGGGREVVVEAQDQDGNTGIKRVRF
jgi:hypothetical protein